MPVSILKTESRQVTRERVFDRHFVEAVVQMMEGVTTPEGTAPGAAVLGYRVAGKTGTSRIVGPKDTMTHDMWHGLLAWCRPPSRALSWL